MERIISDEEKIRRAIEISQRRNRGYIEPRAAKVSVNHKKNYSLFKRMILQMLICLLIYFIFYLITTTNYIFSEDIIKQTSSVLNYDINFQELYHKGVNEIKGFTSKWQEQNNQNQEENYTLNESNETNTEKSESEKDKEVGADDPVRPDENKTSMTQMEQDAIAVKESCDFELPLKGNISSGFRRKRSNFTSYVGRS